MRLALKIQSKLLLLFIFFNLNNTHGQVINNNGAYISISSGTYLIAPSFANTTGTLLNSGTAESTTLLSNAGELSGNGTYKIGTSFTNTGTFTTGQSTVEFNGSSSQTIPALNYYNLTSSNTGARTFPSSGTVGVAATFTKGSNSFATTGSTVDFNGGAQTIPVLTYNNLILSGSNTKTLTGLSTINGNFTMNGNGTTNAATTVTLSVGGDMTINEGNTLTLINGDPSLNVTGNTVVSGTVTSPGAAKTFGGSFTINSGGSWTEQASPIYNFSGNFVNNGTFNASTSTANFNGVTIITGSSTTTFHNINVTNGNTLISSSGTVNVTGDFINNGTFNHNNGTIVLSSSSHNIGGSGALIFNNLTIDAQTGAERTLTSSVTVGGILNLTRGYFISSPTNPLIISNGGSVSGGSDFSYVNGPIRKIGTNGAINYEFIYPVGLNPASGSTNKTYSPVKIKYRTVSSDDITFTVTHFHGSPATLTPKIDRVLQRITTKEFEQEYWDVHNDIAGTSGTTTDVLGTHGVDVTLYFANPGGDSKNKTRYYLTHAKTTADSTYWEIPNISTQVSEKDITVFGKRMLCVSVLDQRSFSGMGAMGTDEITPVTLTNFNARLTPENKVALSWATASESVNKGFRIERQHEFGSTKFQDIGFVPSKAYGGNSAQLLYYNFTDIAPKVNATSYYRLAQEDIDGKLTNSEVRMIRLNGQSVSLVYPNPSKGNFLISRTADGKKMDLQVTDQSGKIIRQVNGIESATHKLFISQPGIYNIKLTYPETGEQSIQRVVVY